MPGIEFEQAIETMESIYGKTKDRIMYDQREKAQRDYQWAMSGARAEGLEQGLEQGRASVASTVRMLEELLGEQVTSEEALKSLDIDQLTSKVAQLQQRLLDRPA